MNTKLTYHFANSNLNIVRSNSVVFVGAIEQGDFEDLDELIGSKPFDPSVIGLRDLSKGRTGQHITTLVADLDLVSDNATEAISWREFMARATNVQMQAA